MVGGVIDTVAPGSIAEEIGLCTGDRVIAVNGSRLRDVIDYRFAIADETIELLVEQHGEPILYEIEKDIDDSLGIDFTEPLFTPISRCKNQCPFCFVTQMPRGMRKTLYVKDDDFRLSFLYGNFITLTNLTEDDWQRIEEQHLSPLYVSVHATDPQLRSHLLGNPAAPDIREQIRRLGEMGIEVHTQIVTCPGINDGEVLKQTIEELSLMPTVGSIAVVPLGITRYRSERADRAGRTTGHTGHTDRSIPSPNTPLRSFEPSEVRALLEMVRGYADRFARQRGISLVYPSDEFFLVGGGDIPEASFYDDFPQYFNGVGMARDLLDTWEALIPDLPRHLATPQRLVLVCGTLIAPLLTAIAERLNQIMGLHVDVVPVVNRFFGETVTVSGLLTGQDVIAHLQSVNEPVNEPANEPANEPVNADHVLLPRAMFEHRGVATLDDYSPAHIAEMCHCLVSLADGAEELFDTIHALSQTP
jgi:putative radical SAM enzyme (TIGR03279 family)